MFEYSKVTVGIDSGDIRGANCRAIQLAVDAMSLRPCGGTVEVLPGEYIFEAPLRLRSNVAIVGTPGETIFRHGPVVCSKLAVDADTGQMEFTPAEPDKFCEGMGVIFRDNSKTNKMAPMPRTIISRRGNAFELDDYVEEDWIADSGGLAVSYYPLIHGFRVEHASVEGVVLDGTADSTEGLEVPGWELLWGGGVYMRYCEHCLLKNVESRNFYGDGLRWGRSKHTVVDGCHAHHNKFYGMHPGSHSPYTTIKNSRINDNGSDGMYLCWGVYEGEFTDNEIFRNGYRIHRNGISIGHKDTDNLIARNHVYENAKHGICFRVKTEANGAHRNMVCDNVIENNGRPIADIPAKLTGDIRNEVQSCGVFMRGVTKDVRFERNIVRETRPEGQRYQHDGFYLDINVSGTKLVDNEISGHPGAKVADGSGDSSNDLQGF